MARDSYGSIRKEVNIFIESTGNYVAYPRDGGEWLWIHYKVFKKYKGINGTIDGSFLIILDTKLDKISRLKSKHNHGYSSLEAIFKPFIKLVMDLFT